MYFWNLEKDLAANTGCPVRVYFSAHAEVAVWNKISFPFTPALALPDSTEGFKLYVKVTAASIVNEISIYTDAAAYGSATVTCLVDSSATEKYIICSNIGKLTGG